MKLFFTIIPAILVLSFATDAKAGKNIRLPKKVYRLKGVWEVKARIFKSCLKNGRCFDVEKYPGRASWSPFYHVDLKGAIKFSGNRQGVVEIKIKYTYSHRNQVLMLMRRGEKAKFKVVEKLGKTYLNTKGKGGFNKAYVLKLRGNKLILHRIILTNYPCTFNNRRVHCSKHFITICQKKKGLRP